MKGISHLLLILLFLACSNEPVKTKNVMEYATTEAAMKRYRQGWSLIMDEGRYEEAEASYRLAVDYDTTFLVGKSVLARLTLDLDERLRLHKQIDQAKERVHGDERLVLDVYTALVHYTNVRDLGSPETKKALDSALALGERNLRKVVHKYPGEIYLKSEYIEFLHSLYGPRQALDSLTALTNEREKENPFLLGYAASLHAELGEFDRAMNRANRLLAVVNDSTLPKTYVVLADIYHKMGNLEVARKNAYKAYELDPFNLDASRLKNKIDRALSVSPN